MPTSKWTPYVNAIQYTGSNSAEILALIPAGIRAPYPPTAATISSEGSGSVTFRQAVPEQGTTLATLATGDWLQIVVSENGLAGCATWVAGFNPISSFFGPSPVTTIIQEETGAAAIPALLLAGTTSVTVPLSGSFPSTTYQVKRRAVTGTNVLSALTFAETSRTVNSITYTVTATGVATAAGTLLIDAYAVSS